MGSRLNSTNNNGTSMTKNNSSSNNNSIVIDAVKIALTILIVGLGLSYLAEDLGSSVMMATTETPVSTSGGGLPKWLNEHAVSVAGAFTIASILQSSLWLFQSSSTKKPSSCSG